MGQNYFEQESYDRMDKPAEECGVIGVYDFQGRNVASDIYYGCLRCSTEDRKAAGLQSAIRKASREK